MRLTPRLLLGTTAIVGSACAFVAGTVSRRAAAETARLQTASLEGTARWLGDRWGAGEDPAALADDAARALGASVSLVDASGRPVGDSRLGRGRLRGAENLGDRPEILTARAGGVGVAERPDPATRAPRRWVAVRGGEGIVRLDADAAEASAELWDLRRTAWGATLAATVLAALLAWAVADGLVRPIVRLRDVARGLATGDLSRRPALAAPGEVGELAAAVHRVAEQLGARLDALATEESLLRGTLESLSEGVVAVDARRQVVRINETARRLLGARDATPFPGDVLPREPILREALAGALEGRVTDPLETSLGDRTVMLTARPLGPGGAVVALFDVTPIRRLEAMRRDFVANVSHELKTPLTVIGGFAETLLDDELPAASRRLFTESVRTNAVRMQRIVDDLLDLSRIESGGWIPAPTQVEIAPAAADAFANLSPASRGKGLTLACEPGAGAEHLWADPTAVRQVLANLVDNAVRHTATGGVTVSTAREGAGTWLRVRDTGNGIAAEHLPRIFERFYRVDAARSRDAGGTGLGLSIVKHLVEAHRGRVVAESTEGRGTTIGAWFPDPA